MMPLGHMWYTTLPKESPHAKHLNLANFHNKYEGGGETEGGEQWKRRYIVEFMECCF